MSYKPEVYEGDDGQWYWRILAENGKSVAVGGEGFTERNDAWEAFDRVISNTVLIRAEQGRDHL